MNDTITLLTVIETTSGDSFKLEQQNQTITLTLHDGISADSVHADGGCVTPQPSGSVYPER